MHVQKSQVTPTRIKLLIEADRALLDEVKASVLQRLSQTVKLQGFRAGKAPLQLVERSVNPATLQQDFLDAALNRLYSAALHDQTVRPVSQPSVSIKKFVPFTTLEFEAEVEAIGTVTVPDYTKISVPKKTVSITAKDVDEVVENLRNRIAEKKPVNRAAKNGDEVIIDFYGSDAVTNEAVSGAESKDYPLSLGSNSFIPGFEKNLIGLKTGNEKDFTITFPADYNIAALQKKKVNFKVTIKQVQDSVLPIVDDVFAAKVGPFKTVADMKADIKQQITEERSSQADRDYESDLLTAIANKSTVAVPDPLIEEELNRLEAEEKQNILYRGQTWQEHLDGEGVTEVEHRAKNRPGAEARVKAGLVLAQIAETEKIQVTDADVDQHIELLKSRYTDDKMRAELDKPEARREIGSRLMSEQAIARLVSLAPQAKATSKTKTKV